ncbi:MAG: hypothetical protein BWY21_00555 [Parcubacteria group bacterium ADurb.Bin216]|nr:MAG: hypothetical protein BWY21_00555 [Parcubacteria group bacterium ADurb.Bin216]
MIIDYDKSHYIDLVNLLRNAGLEDSGISISDIKVRVILNDSKIVGLMGGDKIGNLFNVHHLYIKEDNRKPELFFALIKDMFDTARDLNCTYLIMHLKKGSREEKFAKVYCRRREMKKLDFEVHDHNIYQIEV